MFRLVALGLTALALAAAAGARAEDPASATEAGAAASAAQVSVAASAPSAKPAQHCWKEYRVGSNMPVTHCESQEENEQLREERLRNIQNQIMRGNNAVRAPGG